MGRGSSGAKAKTSTSAKARSEITQAARPLPGAETIRNKRVNSEILREAVEKMNASDFTEYKQPDSLVVGNVEFRRMGRVLEERDGKGTTYITTYQSTEQATNGEYPVFDIAARKQFNRVKPKFIYGPLGTRLW